MEKRVLTIFLSFNLMLMGCYKRYQLPRIEPTDAYVSRQIEVFTKSGQSYTLITYKITETKIIGKDKEDKQHQILIKNIDRVTVVSKFSRSERLFLGLLAGLVGVFTLSV